MPAHYKTTKRPEPERLYQKKFRPCLMCGRSFLSEWDGNRVCRPCKKTEAYQG